MSRRGCLHILGDIDNPVREDGTAFVQDTVIRRIFVKKLQKIWRKCKDKNVCLQKINPK